MESNIRNEAKWWYKQLRMIQYNLQMKDTPLMDAEKIARETEEMGGNSVVINVADSVVWYNTAVKYEKINPCLPKGRDILEELISEFHKRNIKVFARGAFMGFEEETYYQKPQWAKRNPDGSTVTLGNERPGEWFRLYLPCPNGGFVHEAGLNIALEAFAKYDLDGAFWLGGTSLGGNCYCDHCQSLYREIYGTEMPADSAKLDPRWNYRNGFKESVNFYESIMRVKPEMPFLHYFWPFDLDIGLDFTVPADNIDDIAKLGNTLCTEAQNVLSLGVKKLPEWNTPALRMKMGRTIKDFPPPVGIIHTCPGMDWRHTCINEAEFMYWASQIPANGGSYWTTFTGFADTIPDKRMFKIIGKLNSMTAKIEEPMFGADSDVQILLLADGGIFVQGWAEALMCAHLDFDMLAYYQLSYERIAKYPLVIIPKNFKYPEASKEIFEKYVSGGGHLIVEGTDEYSLRSIRNMLGVDGPITSSENVESTYLRIEKSNAKIAEKIGECDLIPLRGKIGFSDARAGVQVLATWVPAFANPKIAGFPPERASLPVSRTNIPLCVVNDFGEGKVLFLAYEPSRLICEYGMSDMFTMIRACAEFMLGDAKNIFIDAPARVMSTVFKKNNLQMIHFVNGIGQRPLLETIPCFDLTVRIKLDGNKVKSVISKIAESKVDYSVSDNMLTIQIKRLDVWDMLVVEYDNPHPGGQK
jgi:hypothetical protein